MLLVIHKFLEPSGEFIMITKIFGVCEYSTCST